MTYETSKGIKKWRAVNKCIAPTDRKQLNFVIKMFWKYQEVKKTLEREKEDIIRGVYRCGSSGGGAMPHTTGILSSPTEKAGDLLLELDRIILNEGDKDEETVESPELWLLVVDKTLEFLNREDKISHDILVRRYFKNESMPTTCIDMGITMNVYYRKLNFGIGKGRECAIQVGLIKMF